MNTPLSIISLVSYGIGETQRLLNLGQQIHENPILEIPFASNNVKETQRIHIQQHIFITPWLPSHPSKPKGESNHRSPAEGLT